MWPAVGGTSSIRRWWKNCGRRDTRCTTSNPPSGDPGFKWSSVSEDFMEWSPQEYREQLGHPKAVRQFANDIEAMETCDACVLVLPCGRSAHTEAGWFAGKGRTVIAYIPVRQEPELMYKLFSGVCCSMEELIGTLE